MIRLHQLSKKYSQQFVVNNLNLQIKKGEVVGFLGPNGAGKTTTLKMIAGVIPPTSGKVEINHQDLDSHQQLKKLIGFLPENNPLYEEMTVEEYLDFWADIKEIPKEEKKETIDFVVERCGIKEVYYKPISELSKGYRQRVGFSQAILTKAEILILDEPTEGLDPNQRQEIACLIKELAQKRTVIIASHVLSELAKIASRLVIINKGQLVADGSPQELKKMAGKCQVIEIEVKGSNVLNKLKKVPGVFKVRQKSKNYFILETDKRKDIRAQLFQLAVKNKWLLLTLFAKEQAIEDVFKQLTQD